MSCTDLLNRYEFEAVDNYPTYEAPLEDLRHDNSRYSNIGDGTSANSEQQSMGQSYPSPIWQAGERVEQFPLAAGQDIETSSFSSSTYGEPLGRDVNAGNLDEEETQAGRDCFRGDTGMTDRATW